MTAGYTGAGAVKSLVGTPTSTTTVTSDAFVPNVGDYVVVSVMTINDSNTTVTFTPSVSGFTVGSWTERTVTGTLSVYFARVSLFYAKCTASASGTATITRTAGSLNTQIRARFATVTGADTPGNVSGTDYASNSTTGATCALTLAAGPAGSITVGAVLDGDATGTVTQPGTWSEDTDAGDAGWSTLEVAWKVASAANPSWSALASVMSLVVAQVFPVLAGTTAPVTEAAGSGVAGDAASNVSTAVAAAAGTGTGRDASTAAPTGPQWVKEVGHVTDTTPGTTSAITVAAGGVPVDDVIVVAGACDNSGVDGAATTVSVADNHAGTTNVYTLRTPQALANPNAAAATVARTSTPTLNTDMVPAKSVTLPTRAAGDLMLAFVSSDSVTTAISRTQTTAWAVLYEESSGVTTRHACFARIATNDANDALTVAATNAQDAVVCIIVIDAASHGAGAGGSGVVVSSQATGSSATANPPNCDGLVGANWLAVAHVSVAFTNAGDSISAAPTNYTTGAVLTKSAASTSSVGFGLAYRGLTGTPQTVDPGTFSNTNRAWQAKTVLVPPAPTPNDGQQGFFVVCPVTTPLDAGDTITVTYGDSTAAKAVAADQWTGINTSTPVLASSYAHTDSESTQDVTVAPGVDPTKHGQVVLTLVAVEGPISDSFTEDADTTDGSWTSLSRYGSGAAATASTLNRAYKIVDHPSGAPSAQAYGTATMLGTSRDHCAACLILDLAAVATNADVGEATGSGVAGNATATVSTPVGVAAGAGVAGDATAPAHAPGTVVGTSSRSLSSIISPYGTAVKVSYYSANFAGDPVVATGVVLRPSSGLTTKLVVWCHGTSGLADSCAPSATNNLSGDGYAAVVASYLQEGWTVAAPDYLGLGGDGSHAYMLGSDAAHSVLDCARAAINLHGELDGVAITGHSQGGSAALSACELAGYAPELPLVGVVALSPASQLENLVPLKLGTGDAGLAVMVAYGYSYAYTADNVPGDYFKAAVTSTAGVLNSGCESEIVSTYSGITAANALNTGKFPMNVRFEFACQSPGSFAFRPLTVPTVIFHGTADPLIPYSYTTTLAARYAANGSDITLTPISGGDHYSDQDTIGDVPPILTAWFAG